MKTTNILPLLALALGACVANTSTSEAPLSSAIAGVPSDPCDMPAEFTGCHDVALPDGTLLKEWTVCPLADGTQWSIGARHVAHETTGTNGLGLCPTLCLITDGVVTFRGK